ncbi:MAG: glycogen/starch synthase [Candidatus Parvarchaeota archaeon]
MDFFLVEVSFEAGNKVGGIWTVITSKSATIRSLFGEDYLAIGFYNPAQAAIELVETDPPDFIQDAINETGIDKSMFHFGHWIQANNLNILLIDSKEFENREVNNVKKEFWEKFKIDSLNSPADYSEPLAWSYLAGMFVAALSRHVKKRLVCQAHEWLSAGAVLYLKSKGVSVPTVFTIHATVIGRAISYSGGDTINFISSNSRIPDDMPYKYGVAAKHFTEKAGAFNATVFTAVSDTVADEAEVILGKKPDVITINGIDIKNLPTIDEINSIKKTALQKLNTFLNAYFLPYYDVDFSNVPIFFTSGRYEFYDKGFDLFIDALGTLDKLLPEGKNVIAIITVPAGTIAPKNEVVANYLTYLSIESQISRDVKNFEDVALALPANKFSNIDKIYSKILMDAKIMIKELRRPRPTNPPLCPFILSYPENTDAIINELNKVGLQNSQSNKVKVIFYPKYLVVGDELLNLTYNELLSTVTAGFFLSKYEPFGYTPLECASYLSISFTTSNSGFGRYIEKLKLTERGIFAEDVEGSGKEEVVKKIALDMLQLTNLDQDDLFNLKTLARKTAEIFDWDNLISNYLKAYDLALNKP